MVKSWDSVCGAVPLCVWLAWRRLGLLMVPVWLAVSACAGAGLIGEVAEAPSPGGMTRIAVGLTDAGEPRWRAWFREFSVVEESPLGLRCGPYDFTAGLTVERVSGVRTDTERYRLWTGPCRKARARFASRSVSLRNTTGAEVVIELRAADGGVALRYRVERTAADGPVGKGGRAPEGERRPAEAGPPRGRAEVMMHEERTGFRLPGGRAWMLPYQQPSDYTPAYEDYFQEVAVGTGPGPCRGPGPADGWSFPALFRLAEGRAWALLLESGVDGTYCGSHLSDGADGIYRIRFPIAGEYKTGVPALGQAPPQPASTLPWTTPWRAVALADDAGGILTSTWPTDLAQPCAIDDPSWVRPGRASWSWLSTPDLFDWDTFARFADFAAERRWEYSLLDAGWWNVPLDRMVTYARERNVRLLLWGDSAEMYDPAERRKRLDDTAANGVAGLKVDFWSSDKQLTTRTMLDLCRDAAERHLAVVLHGCTIPRAWQRTWPNLLSAEAVLGEETYMFERDFAQRAPRHHTILPFTRNVMGPMDYTPALLSSTRFGHLTTPAHDLALTVLFTSGILHHGGHVDGYRQLPPEALDLLSSVPATWDETRCLHADVGRSVAVARRAGHVWYVAAINGTDSPVDLDLDLASLHIAAGARTIVLDDHNGGLRAASHSWPLAPGPVTLAPYGGWLARAM